MSKSDKENGAVALYFLPNLGTEAEYTFVPNSKFKRDNGSDAYDVGLFLRDNEILHLLPAREKFVRGRVVEIPIKEGKVSIYASQWVELSEEKAEAMAGDGSAHMHGIDQIAVEYLTA